MSERRAIATGGRGSGDNERGVSVVFLIKTSSYQVTSSRCVLVRCLEDVGVAGDVGDKNGEAFATPRV